MCVMKVNTWWDGWSLVGQLAPSTGQDSPLMIDLSKSILVGTRKMVNYA